jgi:anti-sigma factor RsiW
MNMQAYHDDREFRICRYIDGEMTDAETAAFEAQADQDAELRLDIERYRRLEDALGAVGDEPAPVDETAQRTAILSALQQQQQRRPSRVQRLVLKPALAGLAAAAMFLLALGTYLVVVGSGVQEPGKPTPSGDGDVATASMALVGPGQADGGAVSSSLRRKNLFEEIRYRMRPLGSGSVVVSVSSAGGDDRPQETADSAGMLWMN